MDLCSLLPLQQRLERTSSYSYLDTDSPSNLATANKVTTHLVVCQGREQRCLMASPVAPPKVKALPKHDAQQRQPCSCKSKTSV